MSYRMAAAGNGYAFPDDEIESNVLAKINKCFSMYEKAKKEGKVGKLIITLTAINGKSWTTTFSLRNSKTGNTIITNGSCIMIKIGRNFYTSNFQYESGIHANIQTPSCFRPRLESDLSDSSSPRRITATDVLQVLKTKLTLAHPLVDRSNVAFLDEAKIYGIVATEFRILRGQLPLYQKYGYFNPSYAEIADFIKDLKLEQIAKYTYYDPHTNTKDNMLDVINSTLTKINKSFNLDEHLKLPLTEVMKKISLDQEAIYAKYLSSNLFWNIINEFFEKYKNIYRTKFTLNPDSEEWKTWNAKIRIVDFQYKQYSPGSEETTPFISERDLEEPEKLKIHYDAGDAGDANLMTFPDETNMIIKRPELSLRNKYPFINWDHYNKLNKKGWNEEEEEKGKEYLAIARRLGEEEEEEEEDSSAEASSSASLRSAEEDEEHALRRKYRLAGPKTKGKKRGGARQTRKKNPRSRKTRSKRK